MKFYLYSLFLILVSNTLFAQKTDGKLTYSKQYHLLIEAENKCYEVSSLEPLKKLEKSKKITEEQLQHRLSINKLIILGNLYELYQVSEIDDTNQVLKKVFEVLSAYDHTIDSVDCQYKSTFLFHKFEIMDILLYKHKNIFNDSIQKKHELDKKNVVNTWHLPPNHGLGLGLILLKGNDYSIGADVSFSLYEPSRTYKYSCDNIKQNYSSSQATYSINLFNIGYRRHLETEINEFSFSLFDLNYIVSVAPIKFGVQTHRNFKHLKYFYRPSVGLSIGPLSISYAYNLMLNKIDRSDSDHFMVLLKVSYPIYGEKYL